MPYTESSLQLDPAPVSAGEARRFLRALLVAAGREEWLDQAELAISEIVTNAVLHAHTPLEVTARLASDQLRVEVRDLSPLMPLQRAPGEGATTGRGLDVVAAVSADFGVESVPPVGKVVWFVVDGTSPTGTDDGAPGAWDVDLDDVAEHLPGQHRTVTLPALPVALWFGARAHHNAILREYALHVAADPDSAEAQARVALADRSRSWIWTAVLAAVDRALGQDPAHHRAPVDEESGPPPGTPRALDVAIVVPVEDGQDAFLALQDVLDDAERLALDDRLLVRPGLPEIIAVRDWACEQAVAQLAGVAPSPWHGGTLEQYASQHLGPVPLAPEWDARVVSESDRGVVAADEGNRILAVSRPLAAQLGWEVDDLVGRRVTALVPPAMREAHVAGFSRHQSTGSARILGVALQLPVLRADGSEVTCDFLIEQAPGTPRPVYLAWIRPTGAPATG